MINSISLAQFKNVLFRQTNVQQNNNSFKFQGNNLKPLAQDTISFGSVHKYLAAIENEEVCNELHNNAEEARNYFENALTKHFAPFVYSKENPNGLIAPIQGRIKTSESIQEKVASRIERAMKKGTGLFYAKDPDQIKLHIRDIVGARITMRNAHDNNTDKIVQKICEAIKTENLIIDEIENHIPNEKSYKPYFTEENLKDIKDAVNEIRNSNGLDEIKVKHTKMDTGYMALHLDVDLGHTGSPEQKVNYHGELQIIGADVAKLKEVEDYCYKLTQGKNIKSGHASYSPFEKLFLEVFEDEKKYPNIKDDFRKYTKAAYMIQREKQLPEHMTEKEDTTNWAYKYPTIKECEEYISKIEDKETKLDIPPLLDFNILARIERDCRDIHLAATSAQDILDGKIK